MKTFEKNLDIYNKEKIFKDKKLWDYLITYIKITWIFMPIHLIGINKYVVHICYEILWIVNALDSVIKITVNILKSWNILHNQRVSRFFHLLYIIIHRCASGWCSWSPKSITDFKSLFEGSNPSLCANF